MTGDFYTFNNVAMEWVPSGNMGVHNKQMTASISGCQGKGASDYVKKVREHEDHIDDQKPVLIKTGMHDVKCKIKKEFLSHWLFNRLTSKLEMASAHPITNSPISSKRWQSLRVCWTEPGINSR